MQSHLFNLSRQGEKERSTGDKQTGQGERERAEREERRRVGQVLEAFWPVASQMVHNKQTEKPGRQFVCACVVVGETEEEPGEGEVCV